MKKDDQLVNLITMIKRLHKQQAKAPKKVEPCFTSPIDFGQKSKRKPIRTQACSRRVNNQSQDLSTVCKKPISILMLSSRNGVSQYPEGFGLGRDNGIGNGHRRQFNNSEVGARSLKFRNEIIKKKIKSEITQICEMTQFGLQNYHDSPSQVSPSSRVNKITFDIHPHTRFHYLSPPKTKPQEPTPSPSPVLPKAKTKRLNNYNKYCSEIYQKYSNRIKTNESNPYQGYQYECQCEMDCGNRANCNFNKYYGKYGRMRKAKGKEGMETDDGRWIQAVKKLDLKAVAHNGNQTVEEKDQKEERLQPDPYKESEETDDQLRPKLQQASHLNSQSQFPQTSPKSPAKLILNITSLENPSPSRSHLHVQPKPKPQLSPPKSKNPSDPSFEQSEIKIEGWQVHGQSNNRILYGNVKNIVSRSASIHGADFL